MARRKLRGGKLALDDERFLAHMWTCMVTWLQFAWDWSCLVLSGLAAFLQVRTKTVNNNLNPMWDFKSDLKGFHPLNDTLQFEVWDSDVGNDQILGSKFYMWCSPSICLSLYPSISLFCTICWVMNLKISCRPQCDSWLQLFILTPVQHLCFLGWWRLEANWSTAEGFDLLPALEIPSHLLVMSWW